jgi:hypothetical protein
VKRFFLVLIVAVFGTTLVGIAEAGLPPGWIMTTGTAHSHSVSIPFSQMTICTTPTPTSTPAADAARTGVRPLPSPVNREPTGNFLSDPIVSFEGLHVGQLPVDTHCSLEGFATDDSGAVGFNHYVQFVNTAMVVYDKSGNVLAGPVGNTTFWQNQPDCGGDQYWSDAVVRFDRYANRWIVTRPGALPNGQDLCVAVSQTSDPRGAYDQYAFEVNNTDNGLSNYFNDYPKIAVFTDAYYATADPNKIFSGLGNTISAFEKTAMLRGDPDPQFVTFFVPAPQSTPPQITHSHMLAADVEGRRLPPRGSPEYVVQVQDSNLGFPAGRLQVYEFHVDWNSPSSSTFVPTDSLVPETFNSNACENEFFCIEQPGVPQRIDSVSYGYMMQRLTLRNFGVHQTLLFNHTVAADGDPSQSHAGIRWYELRRQLRGHGHDGLWQIYQQGTYAPDANNRWIGSIAMDRKHNIAIGFNVSSSTVFPSIHYAGRRPNDPLGTFSLELSLMEGNGAQLDRTEYGDYSQMSVDPVDDCTFWYTGTYYPATGLPNDWHTRIGSFRFGNCPGRGDE